MRAAWIFLAILTIGCNRSNKISIEKKITAKKALTSKDSIQIETRENERADSIIQTKLLDTALKFAELNLTRKGFQKSLYINRDSSKSAIIKYGHLFSKRTKHLFLRTNSSWNVIMRLFVLDKGKLKQVLSRSEWDLNYIRDTIKDVNGDGFNDFISITYSSAGCCARSNNNVSLYQPKAGTFSDSYYFINPSYSPFEKVIRGVNYGHPGEVPLYKYKWDGMQIDTIEYIYPADTLKNNFYLVHHRGDENDPQKRKLLSAVPKEYRKIDGYDWFMNY